MSVLITTPGSMYSDLVTIIANLNPGTVYYYSDTIPKYSIYFIASDGSSAVRMVNVPATLPSTFHTDFPSAVQIVGGVDPGSSFLSV